MRTVLQYWADGPLPQEPPAPAVTAYGKVPLTSYAPLTDFATLSVLAPKGYIQTTGVASFEAMNISRGWALYCANNSVTASNPNPSVSFKSVSDLALVGAIQGNGLSGSLGFFYRPSLKALTSPSGFWSGGARPAVLVENMGACLLLIYVCYMFV